MGVKGENTKQEICSVARNLFIQKGFKDVTMQDICDAAGLSKGGLYRHYSNKGDILLSVMKRPDSAESGIENGESATDILNAYLDFYREDMLYQDGSLALAIYEYASLGNENIFVEGTKKDKKRWESIIQYGIKTGEFNDVDPQMVMDVLLYAYRGVKMWNRVIPMEPSTADHIVDAVRKILIKS